MQCPRCRNDNPATNLNCAQCGASLRQEASTREPSAIPLVPPRPVVQQTAPLPYGTPPPYPGGAGTAQPGGPGLPPALPQFGSLATAGAAPLQYAVCGVCGSGLFAGQGRCLRCGTPPGAILNPNDPTATQFLPFGPPVDLISLFRAGEERSDEPMEHVGGWNWPAALFPTIWAGRHRFGWQSVISGSLTLMVVGLYLLRVALHRTPDASGTLTGFLVACALIFGLPRSVTLGLRGNTLAWRTGLYSSREQLRKAHRSWTVWAIIGFTVLATLLGVATAILNAA